MPTILQKPMTESMSDQFDYTKWQRHHFDDKTPEQISTEATIYVTENPYTGDPSTII